MTEPACDDPPTYSVVLLEVGENRLEVMKAIRHLWPANDLATAKRFVENTPVQIADEVGYFDADHVHDTLFRAGATVQLTDVYGNATVSGPEIGLKGLKRPAPRRETDGRLGGTGF